MPCVDSSSCSLPGPICLILIFLTAYFITDTVVYVASLNLSQWGAQANISVFFRCFCK